MMGRAWPHKLYHVTPSSSTTILMSAVNPNRKP